VNAVVLSIQVGLPRELESEKPWTSGFLKESVVEPIWLGATNLAGDGQADLEHHGGPHKAVCVYSNEHYPYWRQQLHNHELSGGDFGENVTIDGLSERDVCIGDVWSIGGAVVQVSQPRQPCWKLARRWAVKDLALQVQQTGFTGWYFRVLTESFVQQGMRLELQERRWPQWTVSAANHVMHHDQHNLRRAEELAAVPALSPSWQATLSKRVQTGQPTDAAPRLGS